MLKIYGLTGTNIVKNTEQESNLCFNRSMKNKKKKIRLCRTSEVVVGTIGMCQVFQDCKLTRRMPYMYMFISQIVGLHKCLK